MNLRVAIGGMAILLFFACGGRVGTEETSDSPANANTGVTAGGTAAPSIVATTSGGSSSSSSSASSTQNGNDVFTAVAFSESEQAVYVAEVLGVDSSTIWRIDSQGNKLPFVSGLDVGSPTTLAATQTANGVELLWIDGSALKSSMGSTVNVELNNVRGNTIAVDEGNAYVELGTGDELCIALVGSKPIACTTSAISQVAEGGNGFRVIGGTLYTAGIQTVQTTDLSTGTTTEDQLPGSFTKCDSEEDGLQVGCARDLAVDKGGTVYLASVHAGLAWGANSFSVDASVPGALQIEVSGANGYLLLPSHELVAFSLSALAPFTISAPEGGAGSEGSPVFRSALVTSNISISTRFTSSTTSLFWISADGSSILSAAF